MKDIKTAEKEIELIKEDIELLFNDKAMVMVVLGLCKRYHKAKLNTISDEQIDKHFGMGGNQKDQLQRLKSYKQGISAINWFKNKLLNDL